MAEKKTTIAVSNGAEAFLAQIKALGSVRYMFANTGTDHGPLIEAMAKTAREDPRDIQPIVVPHEQAAVSMAHGSSNVMQCAALSRCWPDTDHGRGIARRQKPEYSLAAGIA